MTFTYLGIAFGALAFLIYIFDFHARRKRAQVHSYLVEGAFVFVTTLAWGCVLQTGDKVPSTPSVVRSTPSIAPTEPTVHPYVSSTIKTTYHRAECRYAGYMEHAKGYATREEAEADGKWPCKVCLPVEVASLRGQP